MDPPHGARRCGDAAGGRRPDASGARRVTTGRAVEVWTPSVSTATGPASARDVLATDVPEWVARTFRVKTDRASWSAIGLSTGGVGAPPWWRCCTLRQTRRRSSGGYFRPESWAPLRPGTRRGARCPTATTWWPQPTVTATGRQVARDLARRLGLVLLQRRLRRRRCSPVRHGRWSCSTRGTESACGRAFFPRAWRGSGSMSSRDSGPRADYRVGPGRRAGFVDVAGSPTVR